MTDHPFAGPDPDRALPAPRAADHGRRPWLVHAERGTGEGLSPHLAQLVLDAYTRAYDLVVSCDNDPALAEEAARRHRYHHVIAGTAGLPQLEHAAGYIDLLLVRWPRPPVDPLWMLATCHTLVRRTGYVVLVVKGHPRFRVSVLTALVGAASTAGLRIADHVAVVSSRPDRHARDAAAGEDMSAPYPHTDLLIFTANRR